MWSILKGSARACILKEPEICNFDNQWENQVSCALISRLCKSMATAECWVPVCMMDAIVAARLLEKIGENLLLSMNGQCYLWTGSRKHQYHNYSTITGHLESGKKGSISAHHVRYCVEHHIRLEDIHSIDVSHLCHNSLCVTAWHITFEPHNVNHNQIACVNRKKCSGHAPFPDCLITLTLIIDGN